MRRPGLCLLDRSGLDGLWQASLHLLSTIDQKYESELKMPSYASSKAHLQVLPWIIQLLICAQRRH